jgi:ketosteroid isomerase-like protein
MSSTRRRSLMNEERCAVYAQKWISAWNAHDLDRIMSHYAEDLEFTSPLILQRRPDLDGTIRDLGSLRAYFAVGLESVPSLVFQLLEVLRGVDGFCMYYLNARGGHTAEYVELNDDDKATKVITWHS